MTERNWTRRWASASVLFGLAFGTPGWSQTGTIHAGAGHVGAVSVPAASVHADGDIGLSGEAPLDTTGVADPTDMSAVGSPVGSSGRRVWIRANTRLSVRLNQAVSSGAQRNGDTVSGVLQGPVTLSNSTTLKAGTPIKATIVSSAKAGTMSSGGVLSLQVFQVGGVGVISNVLDFDGKEGQKEVADAAPTKGTEAVVPESAVLQFQVLGSGDKFDPNERVGGVAHGGAAAAASNQQPGASQPAGYAGAPPL